MHHSTLCPLCCQDINRYISSIHSQDWTKICNWSNFLRCSVSTAACLGVTWYPYLQIVVFTTMYYCSMMYLKIIHIVYSVNNIHCLSLIIAIQTISIPLLSNVVVLVGHVSKFVQHETQLKCDCCCWNHTIIHLTYSSTKQH